MVRDVYAADDGSAAHAANGKVRASYRVVLDLDPSGLSRVVQHLALANLAPTHLACSRIDEHSMEIRATLQNLSATTAELICRKLSQLTCVFEADCSTEPLADASKEIA